MTTTDAEDRTFGLTRLTPAELAQFRKVLQRQLAALDRVLRRMTRRRWWRIDPCHRWLSQAREGLAGAIAAVDQETSRRRPPPPIPVTPPIEEGWEEELAEDARRHQGPEIHLAQDGG